MKIKTVDNEFIQAEIIRYFSIDDNEYLIYSLNESDDAGYIKLYASKIIGSKACIITDNDEWDIIKQIIKDVVRCNRDGSKLEIMDLDEDNLNDIILQDTRVFKLQGNLVTLLSENKNVIKKHAEEEIIDETIDYEALYNEQIEKNNQLTEQVSILESKIELLQNKIDNIKELLD